jgi:hypothetical protein
VTRLDLPDGEWAELCSPRKVSDRRRRAYLAAVADAQAATANLPHIPGPPDEKTGLPGDPVPDPQFLTGEHIELQTHAFDLLVMCFVKAWSLEPAVSLEAVEDLDTGTKDTLVARCLEFMTELMPDYSPDPDPKAPTSGSPPPPPGSSTAAPTFEIPSYAPTS